MLERNHNMCLSEAKPGVDVIIKDIITDDEELKSFLFSYGNKCIGCPASGGCTKCNCADKSV